MGLSATYVHSWSEFQEQGDHADQFVAPGFVPTIYTHQQIRAKPLERGPKIHRESHSTAGSTASAWSAPMTGIATLPLWSCFYDSTCHPAQVSTIRSHHATVACASDRLKATLVGRKPVKKRLGCDA